MGLRGGVTVKKRSVVRLALSLTLNEYTQDAGFTLGFRVQVG